MTPLEKQQIKKLKASINDLEGALTLAAQRLHNSEVTITRLGSVLMQVLPPAGQHELNTVMNDFFQCGDSLGAFDFEGLFTANEQQAGDDSGVVVPARFNQEDNDNDDH